MAVTDELQMVADEARRYAGFYPEASDGRNTFIIFAEWVEKRLGALVRADARMAELEAQGWELSGSITDLGQRLETAETLLEEARRALEPFIRLADNVFSDGKNATVADEVTLWCFNDTDITFGDLRRARATHDRIGK